MSAVAPAGRAPAPALGASRRVRTRQAVGKVMQWVFFAATASAVVALSVLLWSVVTDGWGWLSWDLLTNMPSRKPERSGLSSALWGSIWVIALTAAMAFPVGVGAAIYLEEYSTDTWINRVLQVNIANLAGVPSVVYGLLGLGIFIEVLGLGRSILAGALTLALLILPVIIIAGREAIRAVPLSLRQAAYGLGATRWQVTRHHVLPAALPGILTGTILAISRAIGETAPLLVAGAAGYVIFKPDSIGDQYTVLPIQIYQWASAPQREFKELAAAGIIVLLVVLLSMNALAIYLRQRFSRTRW